MFKKRYSKDKIDYESLNMGISLSNKILKILFYVIIICGVLIIGYLFKQWKIFPFFKSLLKVLTPFFIGFVIAWLLNPVIKRMCKHGFNRLSATIVVYVLLLAFLSLLIAFMVPNLKSQLNEFINLIPKFSDYIKDFINDLCGVFVPVLGGDVSSVKEELYASTTSVLKDLTVSFPDKIIGLISALASGIGSVALGLFIGLYLSLDFDNVSKVIIKYLPKSWQEDAINLMDISNKTLVSYIQGLLITTTLICLENSIGFTIAGLKAGLLFAFFCGITNIIPYIGPYIGGIPAVIVGFSQGITVGVITLISVLVAQVLDNIIFTPLVQSKNLKLHPVTIIISLLVFGNFFGILGMILAAPLIAIIKVIFEYYNEKYELLKEHEIEPELLKSGETK